MVTITFKKMELTEDQNTVRITGDCFGHEVKIELSILQLAKIFGTDREVGYEIKDDFGSTEYEDKCEETRKYVKQFPDIHVWDTEMEFGYVSTEDESWAAKSKDPRKIKIYAEDIVGWDNEGIRIDFPAEVFNKEIKGKKFGVFSSPFYVELKTKE